MKRASIYLTNGKILFGPQNVTVRYIGIMSEPLLVADANDNPIDLGVKLNSALESSKEGIPDMEYPKIRPILLKLAGVKSNSAFEMNAKFCNVYIDDENRIHFIPTKNMRPKSRAFTVVDVSLEIIKSLPLNPEEIGKTLLETFDICE